MTTASLLVIEDDAQIARFLLSSLRAEGYRVTHATKLREALAEAQARQPDLYLLDLGLPDGDGLQLIPQLRQFSQAPILVVSARGQESDRIDALDLGADDFITKPFSAAELHARIRAALRRARPAAVGASSLRLGDALVDWDAHVVRRNGEEFHLTPTEYKLLRLLTTHAGKVLTQRFLLNEVWGPQSVEHSQYLRVYMAQLRRKLETDPARPRYLRTETGVGYRLQVE
jgi:two-component system, OmpR family, KDP operon response regulator KdpE